MLSKSIVIIVVLVIVAGLLPLLFYSFADSVPNSVEHRVLSPSEQLTIVIAGYGVKTIYMTLALALTIMLLWRQSARDLAVLGWGLAAFLIGEIVCWLNFPILRDKSPLLEYIHSYGMVVCMGCLVFALIEGPDRRIVGFSDADAKCAFLGMCHGCIKYKSVPCGLNRLFKLMTIALICLALMPLNANTIAVAYIAPVFGIAVHLSHPLANQLYEIRFAPLAAIVVFAASLLALQFASQRYLAFAKITFAAGVGHLGFAFFRLGLFAFYRDNLVWFEFWEEATELILLAGIASVLWIFRKELVPTWVEKWRAWSG